MVERNQNEQMKKKIERKRTPAVAVKRVVGHRARSLSPRTDALLVERRNLPDSEPTTWGADDVSAFLRLTRKLERAIMWALGENGDFAQRKEGQGAYWWRTELRKRCAAMPNVES